MGGGGEWLNRGRQHRFRHTGCRQRRRTLDHNERDDRRHEADGGGNHKRLVVSGDNGTCTLREGHPRDRPSDVDQNRQSHGHSDLLGGADETGSDSPMVALEANGIAVLDDQELAVLESALAKVTLDCNFG